MWKPSRTYSLYNWQDEAVNAWEAAGCNGIVEAVTGSGKTMVGIEAIDRLVRRHPRLAILIVVPNEKLLHQWKKRLESSWTPTQRVGLLGSGHTDDFSKMPVACVGIINSVVRRLDPLLSHTRSGAWKTLLIADEFHRYIDGDTWSKILKKPFTFTLGLSATIEPYRVDGIGEIVYTYGFGDAGKDGLIPPFDLIRTLVALTPQEHAAYFDLDEEVRRKHRLLMDIHGEALARVPDELFFRHLQKLLKSDPSDRIVRGFLLSVYRRMAIAHLSKRKLEVARQSTHSLVSKYKKKTMVFFERTQSADSFEEASSEDAVLVREFAGTLRQNGMPLQTFIYHSKMSKKDRAESLDRFSAAGPSALVACKSLDEGLDLPEVDAAVLASSTQSVRQRIQRIGRTLRRGHDDKRSIVISLHVQGTGDTNSFENDRDVFGGIAGLHRANDLDVLGVIKSICTRSEQ